MFNNLITNISSGIIQQGSLLNSFLNLSINNILSVRADSPLALITPAYVTDENNELVHPCVIYEKNGWNGYKYWMCVNPLPDGDASNEDPCFYVSNDGVTWNEPDGLVNPIATKTNVLYHLSDSYITLTPTKDKMLCYWRETGSNVEWIWLSESANGIDWSTPVKIIEETTTNEMVSSSFVYKSGTWYMISVKDSDHSLTYRTGSNYNSFGNAANVVVNGLAATDYIWHAEIKNYGGIFFMLAMIRSSVEGRSNSLMIMKSTDCGKTFIAGDWVLNVMASTGLWDEALYKSSFIFEEFIIKMWYGSLGTLTTSAPYWKIGYTTAMLDQRTKSEMLIDNQILAIGKTPPYIFGDLFERTNQVGLGTSQSGQIWQPITGSINVINNQAGVTSDGNNRVFIDLVDIPAEINLNFQSTAGSHQEYLLLAYKDSSNYYRIGWYLNRLYIQKISSGGNVEVFLGSTTDTFSSLNYTMKVVIDGTTVDLWLDGFHKKRFTLAWENTSKIGLQITNTITKCDYVISK